jgi:hypothetical protein
VQTYEILDTLFYQSGVGRMLVEALLVPVIKKAVDFLFDEGREVLKAHLDRRDTAGKPADNEISPPQQSNATGVFAMTKDDALRKKIDQAAIGRHKEELDHLLRIQEIQSRNYHLAKEQEAVWGRELMPPIILSRVVSSEKELSETTARIRGVIDAVYA